MRELVICQQTLGNWETYNDLLISFISAAQGEMKHSQIFKDGFGRTILLNLVVSNALHVKDIHCIITKSLK